MANKYGRLEIDQACAHRRTNSRKRWLIIITSLILLVAMTIVVVIGVKVTKNNEANSNASDDVDATELSAGSKAITAACNMTTYPDVCIEELLKNPSALTANPRELVSIAVQIALEHVNEAYYLAANLSKQNGENDTMESYAVADCMEMMDGAKDYLNQSLVQLSDLSLPKLSQELYDVLVWLSTVGSYEEACAEGFNNVQTTEAGPRSDAMQKNQEKLSQVLIIAMGLVNSLSKLGSNLSSWKPAIPKFHLRRKMLSLDKASQLDEEGYPSWLKVEDRKLLEAPTPSEAGSDVVVNQDGSGNYKSIQEAIDNIPSSRSKRWVIYIKAGVYNEYISLSKSHTDISFIGDGMGKTIITGNRNVALQGYTTFRSATVALAGSGFIAKDVTFQNTAGAIAHQAVALRASADFMVFYKCSFEGYQDTLYAHSSRQFYRDCDIYGTVDYIFGNAVAVFQGCRLLARKPMDKQKNTYTAQGRSDKSDPSGYSFQSCSLMATSDLSSSSSTVYTYFGRPWKAYSRTVFIGCYIDTLLHSDGWLPWDATNPFIDTLYYGEYKNTGPGSNITGRVKWGGVHSAMTSSDASIFAVSVFISPLTWLDSSSVPYNPNLPV